MPSKFHAPVTSALHRPVARGRVAPADAPRDARARHTRTRTELVNEQDFNTSCYEPARGGASVFVLCQNSSPQSSLSIQCRALMDMNKDEARHIPTARVTHRCIDCKRRVSTDFDDEVARYEQNRYSQCSSKVG